MIVLIKLGEERWQDYRVLRLEALKKEPLAFGSSYGEVKNTFEGDWKDGIKNVLFAIDQDKPVGIVVYTREKRIKNKHVANIYGVYVAEEYRR